MFRSCLSYYASHCFFFFMLVSHVLVVRVCFRTFLHVVIAFICAMLKIEDQFWDRVHYRLVQLHTFV